MIGLLFGSIRLAFWLCFGMLDAMVYMCTLGKVDLRTRRFF
ncbi:hypothetical protein ACFOSC_26535 [Streptantibioticus rubrisoli]|nr:hypothetical protein [Streptantibioticus rubrisoli]